MLWVLHSGQGSETGQDLQFQNKTEILLLTIHIRQWWDRKSVLNKALIAYKKSDHSSVTKLGLLSLSSVIHLLLNSSCTMWDDCNTLTVSHFHYDIFFTFILLTNTDNWSPLNLLPRLIIPLPGKCIPDLNGICFHTTNQLQSSSLVLTVKNVWTLHLWLYTLLRYCDYN